MSAELNDLYGDLGTSPADLALREAEVQIASLRDEISQLQQRNEVLTRERDEHKKTTEILERNMSCLYATAKAEIERKDRRLASLEN